jgi:hypothetical protein
VHRGGRAPGGGVVLVWADVWGGAAAAS